MNFPIYVDIGVVSRRHARGYHYALVGAQRADRKHYPSTKSCTCRFRQNMASGIRCLRIDAPSAAVMHLASACIRTFAAGCFASGEAPPSSFEPAENALAKFP